MNDARTKAMNPGIRLRLWGGVLAALAAPALAEQDQAPGARVDGKFDSSPNKGLYLESATRMYQLMKDREHAYALEEQKHYIGLRKLRYHDLSDEFIEDDQELRLAIAFYERLKAKVNEAAQGKEFSFQGKPAAVKAVQPGTPMPPIEGDTSRLRDLYPKVFWGVRHPILTVAADGGEAKVSLKSLAPADLLSLAEAVGLPATPEDFTGAGALLAFEGEGDRARKCLEKGGAGASRLLERLEMMIEARRAEEGRLRQMAGEEEAFQARRREEASRVSREEWERGRRRPEELRGLFNATEVTRLENGEVSIFYEFDHQREYKDFLEKDGCYVSGHAVLDGGRLQGSSQVKSLDSPARSGIYLNAVFVDGHESLEVVMGSGLVMGKFRPRPKELSKIPGEWRIFGYDWWWNSGGYEFGKLEGKGGGKGKKKKGGGEEAEEGEAGGAAAGGKTVLKFEVDKGVMRTYLNGALLREKGGVNEKKLELAEGKVALGFGPDGEFAVESARFTGTLDPEWIERARKYGRMPNVCGARWTMLENSGALDYWDQWNRLGGILAPSEGLIGRISAGSKPEATAAEKADAAAALGQLRTLRDYAKKLPVAVREFLERTDNSEAVQAAAQAMVPKVEALADSPSWAVLDALGAGADGAALERAAALGKEVYEVRTGLGEILWKKLQAEQDW